MKGPKANVPWQQNRFSCSVTQADSEHVGDTLWQRFRCRDEYPLKNRPWQGPDGFGRYLAECVNMSITFLTGFAFKAVRRKESAGDLWGLSLTEGGEAKPWWQDPAWFKPFCKRAGQLRCRGTGKYGTEICFGENRTKRCLYIFKENRLPIFRYMTQACAYR